MFLDDLPIWGFVGKVEKIVHTGETPLIKYYLFTHIHFEIRYNGAVQKSTKHGCSGLIHAGPPRSQGPDSAHLVQLHIQCAKHTQTLQ